MGPLAWLAAEHIALRWVVPRVVSSERPQKVHFAFRALGDRSSVQPVGWRDGTVLGSTASICGRAPVQSFRHGTRALNLEACPELRMDTVQPVEDDAASEATRPTSKPEAAVRSQYHHG